MILLNYSFAFGDGLAAAAVSLVGRNMGAGDVGALRGYARQIQVFGVIVSGVLSVVYVAGAAWFFGRFFPDAESIGLGVKFSYMAAILTFLQIPRIVNVGIMRGVGDVRTPMILASLCVFLVNPGVSFIMIVVLSFGIWGVWGGALVSQTLWLAGSVAKTRQLLAGLDGDGDSREA